MKRNLRPNENLGFLAREASLTKLLRCLYSSVLQKAEFRSSLKHVEIRHSGSQAWDFPISTQWAKSSHQRVYYCSLCINVDLISANVERSSST